jgi:nucleoside-diphosphate-sugar epimerase
MRAIVTGADGFVGSYVVRELVSNGYGVLALDLAERPSRLDLSNPSLQYRRCAVEDLPAISDEFRFGDFGFFFHFAWQGSAGPERGDERIQLRNALLTAQALRFASKIGCRRFICAGTIMEFETNKVTYAQRTEPSLPYIYGAGKTVAHEICKPLANSLGIELVWAYITNAYGIGESSPRLLNTTLRRIIHGEKLEFTSGKQYYDFVYVSDVASAFRLIAEKGIRNKAYVIGSGQADRLKNLLEAIVEELKPRQSPVFGAIPFTGVSLPLRCFDIKDIRKDCGFEPSIDFKQGIRLTYEWLKETER